VHIHINSQPVLNSHALYVFVTIYCELQHKDVIRSLRSSLHKRLLQPGATTSDIVDQYILTIKALRYLDPSGVTLEAVGDPIRR
jgi:hypothetical protein